MRATNVGHRHEHVADLQHLCVVNRKPSINASCAVNQRVRNFGLSVGVSRERRERFEGERRRLTCAGAALGAALVAAVVAEALQTQNSHQPQRKASPKWCLAHGTRQAREDIANTIGEQTNGRDALGLRFRSRRQQNGQRQSQLAHEGVCKQAKHESQQNRQGHRIACRQATMNAAKRSRPHKGAS